MPQMNITAWLARASSGTCGTTVGWNEGNCEYGESGNFYSPRLRQALQSGSLIDAVEACLQRCRRCKRCRHVSISMRHTDCSWFASCASLRPYGDFLSAPVAHLYSSAASSRRLPLVPSNQYEVSMKCLVVATISSFTNLTMLSDTLGLFQSWNRFCLTHERGDYSEVECQVLPHQGYGWASAINASAHMMEGCTNVALLLDDVKPVRLDPNGMLRAMQRHNLHMASPTVIGANWRHMWFDMSQKKSAACVSKVDMVEYFATFFSKRGWDCFSDMLSRNTVNTATSAFGYGYDFCQRAFCPGLDFGIVHEYVALHVKNTHAWSNPVGRRLTLSRMPESWHQRNSVRQWVRTHMNSSCQQASRMHHPRLCAE